MHIYPAIVCQNLEAIQTLMSLYAAHWEETTQDRLTGGVSKLMRGPAIGAPDPKFWDCEVIPDGAEMFVSVIGPISRVSVRKPAIFGVTLQSMYTPLPGPKWPFELSGKNLRMPEFQSEIDECRQTIQCTDDDLKHFGAAMHDVWDAAPEWLQDKCVSERTASMFFRCVLDCTVMWLNFYPKTKAPWLDVGLPKDDRH